MKQNNIFILFFIIFFAISSCHKQTDDIVYDDSYFLSIPTWAPYPEIPMNNQLTKSRVELGRKLFNDVKLSVDSSLSCASCHLSNVAFTDNLDKSTGVFGRQTLRNSPTLLNVAYANLLFADGGVSSLETQVLAPIEEFTEMDFHIIKVKQRLKFDQEYNRLSKLAYDRDTIDEYVIARAIAAFERTLYSFNSAFDQYYYGNIDDAISEQAKRGWELFSSDSLNCTSCHVPPLFTDFKFYNIGLNDVNDPGRYRITGHEEDRNKFKTPTLRNIALTSPYFHHGEVDDLNSVLTFFLTKSTLEEFKNGKLHLTENEKEDIVAFLITLTEINE